ncbi:MAG: hypothetical protein RL582_636 [Bacteroidota bacterium]|jgi:hypothetical protein
MAVTELKLQYIKHKDIDKNRWDFCLKECSNKLLYAEADFLDAVSPQWDAIVSEDYEYLMPLTWRRKWGIRYLVQPEFSQQGGIFSKHVIHASTVDAFISLAKSAFSFAEFTFNYKHEKSAHNLVYRTNYILPLNDPYEVIQQKFTPSLRQLLHTSKNHSLSYCNGTDIKKTIETIRMINGDKLKGISNNAFMRFQILCERFQKQNRLLIREVKQDDQLLSTALFFVDENRIYNLLSCISAEGRTLKANHFLYNQLIAEFAESNLTLDFEGSDLAGVSFFYRSFHPREEKYAFVKWNHLPFPIRWLKK